MPTRPKDDILAALRKKCGFEFNPYSPYQYQYRAPLLELEADGLIHIDRRIKKRWLATALPNAKIPRR
jgi:hypothetical protein